MKTQTSQNITPPEFIGLAAIAALAGVCGATADRRLTQAGFAPEAIAILLNKRVKLWRSSKLPEICRVVFPNVQQTEFFKGANAS
jgi:hypothetical protein